MWYVLALGNTKREISESTPAYGKAKEVWVDTRVNLMALGVIAGFILMAAASLLIAWLHARRVDQFPTLFLTIFGLIAAAVLTLLYWKMGDRRAIVFFGAFAGLILLPWVAGLAIFGPQAWKDSSQERGAARAEEAAPTVTDIAGGMLGVVEAKLATYPDGTSISTVRYPDAAAAAAFLRTEHGDPPPPLTQVAGHEGVLIEREGIASFQFQDGAQVVHVMGANRAAVERRLQRPSPSAPRPTGPPDRISNRGLAALLSGVLVYGLFVSWVFVRLSTWAATFPALAGVAPVPAATLRDRLLGVARTAVPFTVRPGDRPDEVIAEWRYADATWLDQMRAHRMRQLIRYRLRLDEADRTVRVLEYRAAFDASAGLGGANLSYRAERGITFFEEQRETVLGLQIKDGRITPDLSYSWSFSVDELRDPLISIVAGAGWTWRQVMLDAPWLTG
ncbi:MAG: hypothetical protein LAN62_01735 [Acidobacteriia bacterium]|nr:hypothetical protein [Terriglobia bacterium]